MPTYPVEVELIGTDGNAFALIGRTERAIRRHAGRSAGVEFREKATSCDSYDELLRFIMDTVEVT